MKWQKVITKAERTHLNEHGILSLKAFKRVREHQVRIRKEGVGPCLECSTIARKLKEAGKL